MTTEKSRGGKRPNDDLGEHLVVGARLREARETLGLTQGDVADALGIPRTSVHAMETGKRNVTGVELRRLARMYRRSVDWLLGQEVDAEEPSVQALFRATSALSDNDKDQVLRFAQFLAGAPSDAALPKKKQSTRVSRPKAT